MKNFFLTFLIYVIVGVSSCDVHEFPNVPESVPFHLQMNFGIRMTEMTEWNHLYDGKNMIDKGTGNTYDNALRYGQIRYIVRAYPITKKQRASQEFVREFVFTKHVGDGYDHDVTLNLPPGDYNIMVWADMVQRDGDKLFYNASNFAEIALQGKHLGNTDFRDAFRGSQQIYIPADILEREPDTLEIQMQRPLAKYEFITTDLQEFIDKEVTRIETKYNTQGGKPGNVDTRINIEDYKVVFYYSGFMPNAYSLFTDKPVDAMTGEKFESSLERLNDTEASVGFDYVFVPEGESVATIQIGIYDKEGEQVSLSERIEVPLKRSYHTVMRGMFLMSKASGSIGINPGFAGDHNMVIP